MPLCCLCTKARFDAAHKICRKRNFRQQNQSLPPLPQRLGHSLKVNFCLARARDTPEQCRPKDACLLALHKPISCHALRLGQFLAGTGCIKARKGQIARRIFLMHSALFDQAFDHRRGHSCLLGQLAERKAKRAKLLQDRKHTPPRIRHPIRCLMPQTVDFLH